ncbi:MAG TPA: hypothetical protein VMH90_02975 [Thermoplasmata archaeon]|nr:hypothetical protein [Thermoplasmata archaeon]
MTTVRTLAAHEVVQYLHPRPVTERDELGMIVGRVIDSTVSTCSHEARIGRRTSTTALLREAEVQFDRGVADADLPMTPAGRATALAQVAGVLKAFRASPVFGLSRPKSRMILINGEIGVYAQPDFWDARTRFYEMKSYRPVPMPPDVATQVRLFQLAFPGFEARLIGFARHLVPVETTLAAVPPPTDAERVALLRAARDIGREKGLPTVLEYVDHPIIPHSVDG